MEDLLYMEDLLSDLIEFDTLRDHSGTYEQIYVYVCVGERRTTVYTKLVCTTYLVVVVPIFLARCHDTDDDDDTKTTATS